MKKIIAASLVLVLVMAAAIPAFAASSQSLEEAILVVKSVVSIPDEMTEFTYSSHERELENGSKITLWNLNWNDTDYNESIYAYVDSLGNLVDYYRYNYSDESGLAKVDRAQGEEIAKAFMEKALPVGIAGEMRQINEAENRGNTYNLNYTYQFYHNDIPVPSYTVNVTVDKYAGYVRSFSGFGEGSKMPVFDNMGPEISLEQAKEIFMEQAGVTLKYYSDYDYTSKTLTVFPAYRLVTLDGCAIDSNSGELISLYDSSGRYAYGYGASGGGGRAYSTADEAANDGAGLSEVEQAAVNSLTGLISKDAAEKAARNVVDALKADNKLESASLYQNRFDTETYIWDLYFTEGGYVEVDARTSEIVSFYLYSDDLRNGNKSISEDQAKATAEAFLNKVSADKFKETALSDESEMPIEILRKKVDESDYYMFRYYRQVNGIDFTGNYFTVTVSKNSGQIYDFSSAWYENVTFPVIDNIISEAEAFEVLDSYSNLMLSYGLTSENTGSLVYQFENDYVSYMVDPATGNKINYSGKPYTESGLITEYGDLNGHWAKSIIEELQQNGYYLEGEEFRPDETITQADFLKYLYSDGYWYDDDDEFYKYLQRRDIVKDGEKDPDGQLFRKDAAKFLVRDLGLGLAGEQSDIFINSFTDQVDDSYLGYAALCQSLGIMQGNRAGAFNGETAMTRAEAASTIYQLLLVK